MLYSFWIISEVWSNNGNFQNNQTKSPELACLQAVSEGFLFVCFSFFFSWLGYSCLHRFQRTALSYNLILWGAGKWYNISVSEKKSLSVYFREKSRKSCCRCNMHGQIFWCCWMLCNTHLCWVHMDAEVTLASSNHAFAIVELLAFSFWVLTGKINAGRDRGITTDV